MNLDSFPPIRPNVRGFWHGGDYNPEQWTPEVWEEDAVLMNKAHWNVATVGVFSWVTLEPEEGIYEFEWLRDVLDRLYAQGRYAILATPSAAAPAWLSQKYPDTLRVGADGVRKRHGNRVNYCLTSPNYRKKVWQITSALASEFGDHPALALWHVSNEYGGECYCDLCKDAFRQYLQRKFGGELDKLNAAYWTHFWGHTFTDWNQIEIPGAPLGEASIHGLSIDWRRFVSDQTIDFYLAESEPLRAKTPSIPITTNFMGFYGGLDYWKFAKHVDIASWDSYPAFAGPLSDDSTWVSCAFSHDLTRSLKGGQPHLLMECTPSASNWYPEMELKRPGMMHLEGIQAIAHGSDSVQYFQWRQSRGCQEKFHGGVVGHDGTDRSRVFQDVAALGRTLSESGEIAGSRTKAEVAIVYDWENNWSIEAACGPRLGPKGCLEACKHHYAALLKQSIPVDLLSSEGDFTPYRVVIAPMLYMLKPGVAQAIEAFVKAGGTFVTTYWTGISDENDLCFQGGFPGGFDSPLRRTLGIWNEEIDVVYPGETRSIAISAKHELGMEGNFSARTFCEMIHAETATVLGTYTDGGFAGRPCMTVNRHGAGEAYYVASRNDASFLNAFIRGLAKKLNLARSVPFDLPEGVIARHRTGDRHYLFLMNLTAEPKSVQLEPGYALLSGECPPGPFIDLAPYGANIYAKPPT